MLELPAWPMAESVALGVVGTLALVAEGVMARQPQGVAGVGLLLAALLASWLWLRRRPGRRLATAALNPDGGWRLSYADGRAADATLVPGSRVLGPSLVLKWRVDGRRDSVWLTQWDLPLPVLRALTVRLQGADLRVGA